MVRHY